MRATLELPTSHHCKGMPNLHQVRVTKGFNQEKTKIMQRGNIIIHRRGLIQTLMIKDTAEPNHHLIMFMGHLNGAEIQGVIYSTSDRRIRFRI